MIKGLGDVEQDDLHLTGGGRGEGQSGGLDSNIRLSSGHKSVMTGLNQGLQFLKKAPFLVFPSGATEPLCLDLDKCAALGKESPSCSSGASTETREKWKVLPGTSYNVTPCVKVEKLADKVGWKK